MRRVSTIKSNGGVSDISEYIASLILNGKMLMLYMFKSINTIKSISFREILKLSENREIPYDPTVKQNYAVVKGAS